MQSAYEPPQSQPEARMSSSDENLLGHFLIATLILVLIGVCGLAVVSGLVAESLEFQNVRDLVFTSFLSWGIYIGNRGARFLTPILLLLVSCSELYRAMKADITWPSFALAPAAIAGAVLVFSIYVLFISRSAVAFLENQRNSAKARARERLNRVVDPTTLSGYCEFCKQDVQLDEDYRCQLLLLASRKDTDEPRDEHRVAELAQRTIWAIAVTGLCPSLQDRSTYLLSAVMQAEIHHLESTDHLDWNDFVRYQSPNPDDDHGWFHVTIGASGVTGSNDFQVLVATPRAIGRMKRDGFVPGILVDRFDAATVERAIRNRVESVSCLSWEQLVEELRKFMRWEYEGMAGS